jgi:predicted dehydrogenase
MMPDDRLKIGLLGLGRMGRNHLRVLSMLSGVSLEFVYDLDEVASRAIAAGAGVRFVDDLDAALRLVDAVVICTPTVTHAKYMRDAAEHVRHIFVEKPLTDTLQTSLEIQRLAEDRDLHIQVGFIERYNPAVEQMRRLLDRSRQVVSIDFVRTNKISARITDVDVVTDLMIHDIDLALYLNGPVTSVAAHGVNNDGMIDFASALLTHENGRFSRIQASRITDKKIRSIQATCTDMFIDCELLRKEINLSRQSEVHQQPGQPYVITAISEAVEVPPQEALVSELQAFVAEARGDGEANAPGVPEAVAAMGVCEAVRSAIQSEQ